MLPLFLLLRFLDLTLACFGSNEQGTDEKFRALTKPNTDQGLKTAAAMVDPQILQMSGTTKTKNDNMVIM